MLCQAFCTNWGFTGNYEGEAISVVFPAVNLFANFNVTLFCMVGVKMRYMFQASGIVRISL